MDEAIRVAERNHADADDMKANYFDHLLSSGQEVKAGQVKEREGDLDMALDFYLRGGRPAKAVQLVNNHGANFGSEVLDRIARASQTPRCLARQAIFTSEWIISIERSSRT